MHEDTDLDILLVCLYTSVGNNKINKPKIELLKDRDWVGEFKSSHTAKNFSDHLCICPSWCEPPKNNMVTVQINPGMAFSTGSHETTAACLTWLTQNDIQGKSVIDYGCGSDILALAAVKLGAKKVYAIDIDQQAL